MKTWYLILIVFFTSSPQAETNLFPPMLQDVQTVSNPQTESDQTTAFTQDVEASILRARQLLMAHMAKTNVPGMQVALYKSGKLIWSESFGYSNLADADLLQKDHLLRIGSVSKPLTAIALMKLVEEGKVDLNDDIRKFVLSFPDKGHPIKVRHLLSHQSGIRHYTSRQDAMRTEFYPTVTSSLSIFKDSPLLFEPGTQFHYSSFGYNLLSAVIEGASGMPFLEYMQKRVLTPLYISKVVPDHKDSVHFKRSHFYIKGKSGYTDSPQEDLSYKWASGGYLANAQSLAKLGSDLLQGRIIVGALVDEMFNPQALVDGSIPGYGLGWIIGTDLKERRVIYHNGNLQSGRSYFLLYPEIGLSIAITANTGSGIYFNQREAFGLVNEFLETPDPGALGEFFEKHSGVYKIETTSLDGKTVQGILQFGFINQKFTGHFTSLDFHPRLKSYEPIELGSFSIENGKMHCVAIAPTFVDMEFEVSANSLTGSWNLRTKSLPGRVPKRIIERATREARPKEIKFLAQIF